MYYSNFKSLLPMARFFGLCHFFTLGLKFKFMQMKHNVNKDCFINYWEHKKCQTTVTQLCTHVQINAFELENIGFVTQL